MSRNLEVEENFYKEDFLSAAQATKDKRHYQRLMGLYHIQLGKTQPAVSSLLGVSSSSIQKWIRRYKDKGIDGMQQANIPGGKRKLAKDKLTEFAQAFVTQQQALSGGRLTAKDAQVLLKNKYSCEYKISSVYHLLHEAKVSWISGRSQNPNSSLQKQEAFKKTLLI